MNPIQIIAILFSVLIVVKILVVVYGRKSWLKITKSIYDRADIYAFFFCILSIIVFYFLIQELTLVQIVAAMAFGSLLMSVAAMLYPREFLDLSKKLMTYELTTEHFLYILVWVILAIWVLFSALY